MKPNKEDRYDSELERRRARWLGHVMGLASTLVIMGIFTLLIMEIADGKREIEELKRSCPNPVVEMEEYRGVVHALDRCYLRLDQEQQNVLGMQSELDHWDYVEWVTRSGGPDAEIDCQILLNRALRKVWFDAEDQLVECWKVQQDECWCPFGMEEP